MQIKPNPNRKIKKQINENITSLNTTTAKNKAKKYPHQKSK